MTIKPFLAQHFHESKKLYGKVFLSIFLLTAIAQFFIQFFIYKQADYSNVINISGRQRMLLQKMARLTNRVGITRNETDIQSLRQAKDLFQESHDNLRQGNLDEHLIPPFSSEIGGLYSLLNQKWKKHLSSINCVLSNCSDLSSSIEKIHFQTDELFSIMNEIVFKSSEFAHRQNRFLSQIEIAFFVMIVLLILFEIFFILKPLNEKLTVVFKQKEKSFALLNAIETNAAHAMISTDLNGTILSFNNAAEEMLGYSSEELVGKETPAIFHDLDEVISRSSEFTEKLDRYIEPGFETFICHSDDGLKNQFEWTYVHKDGTTFPVSLGISVLKNESGGKVGYLGIAEDLRDKKKLEKELEAEKLKLVQSAKLATLGEMAAGVAHEINNPLAIISGSSAILAKTGTSEEKRQANYSRLKRSIERISKIVHGLKKFSRSTEDVQLNKVVVSELVNECIVLTEAKANRHRVPVRSTIDSNDILLIDEIQIEQILVNLIGNAIDENTGKPDPWVEISFEENEETHRILVKDSGKGVSPDDVAKLFDPFYTTKDIGKGTGLGLSISKSIAMEHGGDLEYETIEGHTTFVLSLPRKMPEHLEDSDDKKDAA